jgi:hypothetical protein
MNPSSKKSKRGGNVCAYKGCTNKYYSCSSDIKFFHFPSDETMYVGSSSKVLYKS